MAFGKKEIYRDYTGLTTGQQELYEKLFELERLNKGKAKVLIAREKNMDNSDVMVISFKSGELDRSKIKLPEGLSYSIDLYGTFTLMFKDKPVATFISKQRQEEFKNDESVVGLEEYMENNKQKNNSIREFVSNNKGKVIATISGTFPFDTKIYYGNIEDKSDYSLKNPKFHGIDSLMRTYYGRTELIQYSYTDALEEIRSKNITFKSLDSTDDSILEVFAKKEFSNTEEKVDDKKIKKDIRTAKRRLFHKKVARETDDIEYLYLQQKIYKLSAMLQKREKDIVMDRLLKSKKRLTAEEIEEQLKYSNTDLTEDELSTKVASVIKRTK